MDTEDVDGFDFESGTFDLVDDPPDRAGCVCAWEDVFVHEETPGRNVF